MNCPRCGGHRTKRERRKEGRGKKAVLTDIVDEWCEECGWHGEHIFQNSNDKLKDFHAKLKIF